MRLVNLSPRTLRQDRGKGDTMTDNPDIKKPEPRRTGGKPKRGWKKGRKRKPEATTESREE
jgi:hypothetical protein